MIHVVGNDEICSLGILGMYLALQKKHAGSLLQSRNSFLIGIH